MFPVYLLMILLVVDRVPFLQMKEVTLENLRSLVIVSEERPRVNLTSLFTKIFAAVSLNPRAVSSSFGCRANLVMCLQVGFHLLTVSLNLSFVPTYLTAI